MYIHCKIKKTHGIFDFHNYGGFLVRDMATTSIGFQSAQQTTCGALSLHCLNLRSHKFTKSILCLPKIFKIFSKLSAKCSAKMHAFKIRRYFLSWCIENCTSFNLIYWTFTFWCFLIWKNVENLEEKWPFFLVDTAGLGKCCTGGYGRIGVYRV